MKVFINSQQLKQKGENLKVDLQSTLDNRNDDYSVALRDISYYVGYYNISSELNNNQLRYSNGTATHNITIPDGLYSLSSYVDLIKTRIIYAGDNPSNINYIYNKFNGKITIIVTQPYTFSVIQQNMKLLGFNSVKIITSFAVSDNPINFVPCNTLHIHLKQLKNSYNYYNGNQSDILASIPVSTDEFGKLVHYKFGLSYKNELVNTTINSLEFTITDENNDIIDFHGMPVFYTLEFFKK